MFCRDRTREFSATAPTIVQRRDCMSEIEMHMSKQPRSTHPV
jgi:hypothetical protein